MLHNKNKNNEEDKRKEKEHYNPVLMIGEIHTERPNNIEEMIAQKREIKNNQQMDHKNNIKKREAKNNSRINHKIISEKYIQQICPETPCLLSSPFPSNNVHWEALLAVDRSKTCIDTFTQKY